MRKKKKTNKPTFGNSLTGSWWNSVSRCSSFKLVLWQMAWPRWNKASLWPTLTCSSESPVLTASSDWYYGFGTSITIQCVIRQWQCLSEWLSEYTTLTMAGPGWTFLRGSTSIFLKTNNYDFSILSELKTFNCYHWKKEVIRNGLHSLKLPSMQWVYLWVSKYISKPLQSSQILQTE